MSIERRVKRIALSVVILLIPAALVFVMRDGLIAKFLDSAAVANPIPVAAETTSRLATDSTDWHRVIVEEQVTAAAPAPASASAPVAKVPAVRTPKDIIKIRQPTQPVYIGKAAR